MYYTIVLADGTKLTLAANISIKDSTLLAFSLSDKRLLLSYSAGQWKNIYLSDDKGNPSFK